MIEHRQDTGLAVLSMDRKPSPCKECTSRRLGCHGKCDSYKAWRSDVDDVLRERQRQSDAFCWSTRKRKTIDKWFKYRNDWWKK